MAKINVQETASRIMQHVGGVENVQSVFHCVTRLRFYLTDEQKANDTEIKKIPGVLGVVCGMGQYQVILGENLFPVFDEIIQNYPVQEGENVDETHLEDLQTPQKKGFKHYFMTAVNFMAQSMTPFITVLYGAGMLRVVLSLASYFFPAVTSNSTYVLFNYMSQTAFYFMPILVAYGASKVLKSNPVFAITIVAALIYPDFIKLVNAGDPITLLGLPVKLVSYSSSLLPAIFTALLAAWLERFFYKVIPGVLRSVFAPLCVFLVGYPLVVLVLGPAGVVVGGWIVTVIVWIQAHVGGFAPGIIAAIHPFLVMMGVNMMLVPPMTELFNAMGYDNVFRPGWILHNIAEGGSCFAVMLRTKDKDLKSTALSAGIGALVSGVSEPALYGIGLRFQTPIIGVVAGGFAGGAVAGLMGAKAFSMGYSSILGVVIFEQTIVAILAGVAVAFLASFVTTFVLFNEKRDDIK